MEEGVKAPQSATLSDFLEREGFILDKTITSVIEKKLLNSLSRKAFLLRGPAGVGKTQLTLLTSRYLNAQYIFYQCTPGTSEDDLLYKYIPSEETKSGIKLSLGPIPRALLLSRKKKVVLVLDEFDKTRPSADALLLDVLQNHRVSLYVDKKSIIHGDPKNLVIFITSNDFREFSEPLLRRLTVVTLSHLPTSKVYQILSNHFNDSIARLLTQIYDDTIKAGLRKPATLQELYELGEILSNSDGAEIDLLILVKTFIIKYEDDLMKYLGFIKHREPAYLFKETKKSQEESIEEHYIPRKPIESLELEEKKPEKRLSIRDLLGTLKVDMKVNPLYTATEKMTVAFVSKDDEGEVYSTIVKTLRPEPSENPAILGKFELWNVLEKPYIITKNPLKFNEIIELVNKDRLEFEAYVEDTVKITTDQIEKLIRLEIVQVRAYSKRLLRFEERKDDDIVLTELVLDKDYVPGKPELYNAKIKIYVKKVGYKAPGEVIRTIRSYIDYIAEYIRRGILLDRDASVIAEVLKKNSFEEANALWLLNVFKEDIELFKEICRILKKVKIERLEDRTKIYYSNWENELRIYIRKSNYDEFLVLEEVAKNA
jgi:MoxR-like ATPase